MLGKRGQHTSFRGLNIDMESLRGENEDVTAVGNMGVNARGDKIQNGLVTKSAEEMARENYRKRVIEKHVSLKDPVDDGKNKPKAVEKKKQKEVETPEGDIIMKDVE